MDCGDAGAAIAGLVTLITLAGLDTTDFVAFLMAAGFLRGAMTRFKSPRLVLTRMLMLTADLMRRLWVWKCAGGSSDRASQWTVEPIEQLRLLRDISMLFCVNNSKENLWSVLISWASLQLRYFRIACMCAQYIIYLQGIMGDKIARVTFLTTSKSRS